MGVVAVFDMAEVEGCEPIQRAKVKKQ